MKEVRSELEFGVPKVLLRTLGTLGTLGTAFPIPCRLNEDRAL